MNNSSPCVIHYPHEVNDRLAGLGIRQSNLWRALREGYLYKASLTRNNTNAIRGIGTWDAIHSVLAEEQRAYGWTRPQPGNHAIVVYPEGTLCVGVLAGDEATGEQEVRPSNRAPIGDRKKKHVREAISANQMLVGRQSHFGQMIPFWEDTPPMLTYFLVHYIQTNTRMVRAEISLPISIQDKFISEWHERIILTPPADMAIGSEGLSPDVDIRLPFGDDASRVIEETDDDLDVEIEEIDEDAS